MPESTLPPLWRSRAARVASLCVTLGFVGFGFVPQFGGPGYESALAAGLILPAATALGVAFEVAGRRVTPLVAFEHGLSLGFWLAVLGFLIVLGHGLRVGICDAGWGIHLYLLGPLPGALLAGAWGGAVGLAAGRVRPGWRRR